MLVVRLVEEYVFPITLTTLCRPVLEVALRGDTMLSAELLPELERNQLRHYRGEWVFGSGKLT